MKKAALKFLLLTALCEVALCVFVRPVYVPISKNWSEAREYCRENHTDLLRVHSSEEREELIRSDTFSANQAWIGLYTDGNIWKWSNGSNATVWMEAKEEELIREKYQEYSGCVALTKSGWVIKNCEKKRHFFCFERIPNLVIENMTWEEAMDYCRHLHANLISLSSQSALFQAMLVSKKAQTERVWIGLRYLADSWLWVSGHALEYKAWHQGEMPQCPDWSRHCGVLSLEGEDWETWDCGAKLNFICS